MNRPESSWEFNVLNIYNYNLPGNYDYIFEFLKQNQKVLAGDILEAGTYNGRTAMAMALFLEENDLPGIVRACDTFEGFPNYSENDEFRQFETLYANGRITDKHILATRKLSKYIENIYNRSVHPSEISTSGNFSLVNLSLLEKKKDFLHLNNLKFYKGEFSMTMSSDELDKCVYSLIFLDCDLYDGYITTLNYCWPRLKSNGIVFLDEYYSLKFPGPKIAVDYFLEKLKPSSFQLKMISHVNDDFERWVIRKL